MYTAVLLCALVLFFFPERKAYGKLWWQFFLGPISMLPSLVLVGQLSKYVQGFINVFLNIGEPWAYQLLPLSQKYPIRGMVIIVSVALIYSFVRNKIVVPHRRHYFIAHTLGIVFVSIILALGVQLGFLDRSL